MNKTNILIVGNNEDDLQNAVAKINNQPGWNAISSATAEIAIEKIYQQEIDMIVINNSVESTIKLRKIARLLNEDITIVDNNNEDELIDNITFALAKQHTAAMTYSFVDDALKNAMLPITVQ